MKFGIALFLFVLSFTPWSRALQYYGADFSSVVNLENLGLVYKDANSAADDKFETILRNNGANLARIRVWTSTLDSEYSLNYGLALAKRAAAAGMEIYVDLHYSDTWAYPGQQLIPTSWPNDLAGLKSHIYIYTMNLVKAFLAQGTPIAFIEIGNEINDGMLWPTGRISVHGYGPLSQLLHSAVKGVRMASSSAKIVIHLANGWDAPSINDFYSKIFIPGILNSSDIDVMGFSFYPFYGTGATLPALQSSLQGIVTKYDKASFYFGHHDVMIAETNWPVVCPGVNLSNDSLPISAAGQLTWVAGIENVIAGLSGGHGLGLVYWEPGWVGNAGLGSSCADNLLVDGSGKTRSSISMFGSSK
ncbi:glycoside hydrolase family 53 protein [Hebeloma cylindrosporum]|uniref:Arabinogalactan endo-beta-1,4-galactanase n=1 Tax=Hebeloma cylindrosporum TaxID=76867 RepID=A0A0C3CRS5_HEBCY|nr:glycoside hydrolase family 53 protein [Hebeloma cylindrosporum h7]